MAAIGFADSSLAAECMLVRVILNPTCAYRNVNILPNLIVIMQNLCEMAESDWQDISLNALGLIGRLENSHWFIFINGGDDRNLILPEGKWNLLLDSSRSEIKLDEIVDKKLNVGWQSVIWLKHS